MKQGLKGSAWLFLATLFLTLLNHCAVDKDAAVMTDAEMLDFHKAILTIDSHVDTPLRLKYERIDLGRRYDPREYKSKLDYPRMDEGGLDAAFFAVWTPQGVRSDSGHEAIRSRALGIIEDVVTMVARYPERGAMAYSSADADRLAAQGKHGIYLGMENGYPLGTDLANLDLFFQQGIRYVTLCHTSNNEICDSSTDTTEHGGLSPYGMEVVKRMNQLGMMIDISHASDAAVEDVLKYSAAPVIASHSGAKAVCDHPRNLNDSLLLAIAAKGGVIQANLFSDYIRPEVVYPERDSARAALSEKWGEAYELSPEDYQIYRRERTALNKRYPQKLATVSQAVDHIDHIVKLVGVDHVGIGTDLDGGGGLSDCYDVSELPNLTRELFRRGYSKADVSKIWSGNFLRVFKAVEDLAARTQ